MLEQDADDGCRHEHSMRYQDADNQASHKGIDDEKTRVSVTKVIEQRVRYYFQSMNTSSRNGSKLLRAQTTVWLTCHRTAHGAKQDGERDGA